MNILITVLLILAGLFILPFVAYLWGKSQAIGWIEAFKNSNLTLNRPSNGKTKKKDQETEI